MSEKTTRKKVFELLDQNPLLLPKTLCTLLKLDYGQNRRYVSNLRSEWKYSPKRQRGSKCSVHGWRGWCRVPSELDRAVAAACGWLVTRARNRWLLWTDRAGRLMWFETGRVNLWVRKPATLGKAFQLVSNGFFNTGLIYSVKLFETVLRSVRFKGAHYVFETGQRLPTLTVDLFSASNGVVIKVGDRTHPTSLEVIASYPDWGERSEAALVRLTELIERVWLPARNSEGVARRVDYAV